MHHYGRTTSPNIQVLAVLGALSVALAFGLQWVLDTLHTRLPAWFDSPATLGFFAIMYWLFDSYVWRFRWVLRLFSNSITDLRGAYSGTLTSSHNGTATECTLRIDQTYSRIVVFLETPTSRSSSTAGSFCEVNGRLAFQYVFRNEPKQNAGGALQIHYGLATVIQVNDRKSLEIEYFTGRGRMTHGTGTLKRVE